MAETPTKGALLARIREEAAAWDRLLAEVGEERMTQPGVAGAWTFKDVVAHLSGWRRRTIERLAAAGRHQAPPPPEWPANLDAERDYQEINDWFYAQDRDRPLQEVLQESRESFGQLERAVTAVSDSELFEPGRFAWNGDNALCPNLDALFGHFYEEHEADIRAWLAG